MAAGAVLPGSLTARYDTASGGPDVRNELYWVRRKLNFTAAEWRDLSWWEQDMYREGLFEEFSDTDEDDTSDNTPQRQSGPRDTRIAEPDVMDDFTAFDSAFGGAQARLAG